MFPLPFDSTADCKESAPSELGFCVVEDASDDEVEVVVDTKFD